MFPIVLQNSVRERDEQYVVCSRTYSFGPSTSRDPGRTTALETRPDTINERTASANVKNLESDIEAPTKDNKVKRPAPPARNRMATTTPTRLLRVFCACGSALSRSRLLSVSFASSRARILLDPASTSSSNCSSDPDGIRRFFIVHWLLAQYIDIFRNTTTGSRLPRSFQ